MTTLLARIQADIQAGRVPSAAAREFFRTRVRVNLHQLILQQFARLEEEHGMTRQEFAALAGKRPEQITRYLNGPANMTLDTLSDLLLGLGAEPTFAARALVESAAPETETAADISTAPAPVAARTTLAALSGAAWDATSPTFADRLTPSLRQAIEATVLGDPAKNTAMMEAARILEKFHTDLTDQLSTPEAKESFRLMEEFERQQAAMMKQANEWTEPYHRLVQEAGEAARRAAEDVGLGSTPHWLEATPPWADYAEALGVAAHQSLASANEAPARTAHALPKLRDLNMPAKPAPATVTRLHETPRSQPREARRYRAQPQSMRSARYTAPRENVG